MMGMRPGEEKVAPLRFPSDGARRWAQSVWCFGMLDLRPSYALPGPCLLGPLPCPQALLHTTCCSPCLPCPRTESFQPPMLRGVEATVTLKMTELFDYDLPEVREHANHVC